MKLERFNAGWMTAPAGVWRQGEEDPGRPVRVPVSSYLIETDSERILVDTGLHPAAAEDMVAHYEDETLAVFECEQERSIAEQVDLASLTRVVLTHLHFDHAGGLALVPESVPIVVQRAEWEAGHDDAGIELNYFQPRDYAGRIGRSSSSTATTTCSATARSSSSAPPATAPGTSRSGSARS